MKTCFKKIMNSNNNKSVILRLIIFVFICIIPAIIIIKGIFKICEGEIITISFCIIFFILPVLFIWGSFTIIRDNKTSVVGKSVLCIVLAIVLGLICFISIFLGCFKEIKTYKNVEAEYVYQNSHFAEYVKMPALIDMGKYKNISYYKYSLRDIICNSYANIVILEYDSEEYEKEKHIIMDKYVFQDIPMGLAEPQAYIDDYNYKMLSNKYYCNYYPKNVRFIATNDKTKEIIHVYYNNPDLDYIDSTEEFILNDCGLRYIL